MRECVNIRSLTPIEDNKPDDIFIISASPEERCKGLINLISPQYKCNTIYLLKYDHPDKRREENIQYMKKKLNNIGKITEFQINEDKPLYLIEELIYSIKEVISDSDNPKINFDISTVIKWHLLLILKALGISNLAEKVRYLYTEPKDYITELFQPLSFGIKKIFPIPFFSGNYDFSKHSLLILMLGYEGNRALALLEELDPSECLLLIPKPAYHKEWEGRTEKMNRGIINIVGKSNLEYIDPRNPVLVYNKLKSILSTSKYSKYNHIISPLGTKPQTLGLFLYLSDDPSNTILVYGAPLRHNNLFYSEGIGRSWILPIR